MSSTYISSEFHRETTHSESTTVDKTSENVTKSMDRTSNPRSKETFSTFGDGACGEPLLPQHLHIEFAPDEIIDNDIVQRKICAFWKFIDNTPEIRNLMAKPEKKAFTKTSKLTDYSSMLGELEQQSDEDMYLHVTAVSMLESVEEKGLISRTFEARMLQSKCSLGSREYKDKEFVTKIREKKKRVSTMPMCKCTSICRPCPGLTKQGRPSQELLTPVKRLCKKMEDWDSKHTMSMEPPGHPPSLHHCILQRQP